MSHVRFTPMGRTCGEPERSQENYPPKRDYRYDYRCFGIHAPGSRRGWGWVCPSYRQSQQHRPPACSLCFLSGCPDLQHTRAHTCTHTHTHTHMRAHMCTCTHANTSTHTCARTHTHTHGRQKGNERNVTKSGNTAWYTFRARLRPPKETRVRVRVRVAVVCVRCACVHAGGCAHMRVGVCRGVSVMSVTRLLAVVDVEVGGNVHARKPVEQLRHPRHRVGREKVGVPAHEKERSCFSGGLIY